MQFNPAMLFSIGLVSTFISGGLTGIILGDSTLEINVHDTYFVVGHFHIVMGLSAIYGMFAGVYHWFPKMYGRMMNKRLGYLHFWGTFICAYGTFFPMHFLGMAGLPRRYYSNTAFPMFDNLLDINEVVSFFQKPLWELPTYKDYKKLYGLQNFKYVVMFMPFDACYLSALEGDNDLYNLCFEKNIILAATRDGKFNSKYFSNKFGNDDFFFICVSTDDI